MQKLNIDKYEHQFMQNCYCGESGCRDCKVLKGKIPILISAPHSVKQYRVDGSMKSADVYTGTIVKYIHKKTHCYAIVKTYAKGNANQDGYSEYYNAVTKLIKQNHIKLFIDIHGAGTEKNFDVDIADHFSETLVGHEELEEFFKEQFIMHHIDTVVQNEVFVASENTLTYRIAKKFNIPCIELEINKRYRNPYEDKEKFISILNALCEIVVKISETYSLK